MNPSWNELMGRHMRFCATCGAGLGIMSRAEYVERFIHHKGLCPICGKPAIKEDEEEVWLSIAEARVKYGIDPDALGKLIRGGQIRWRPGHHYGGGRQVPEREILRRVRQANRGGVR